MMVYRSKFEAAAIQRLTADQQPQQTELLIPKYSRFKSERRSTQSGFTPT